jgi:hypothetical protein
MRTLLLLSAASMVLAVAPPAGAAESPSRAAPAPQTFDDRYGDDGCSKSSSSYSLWGKGHSSGCQQVTLCHYNRHTQSYQELTVRRYSVAYFIHKLHLFRYPPDIIPAPTEGCPKPGYSPVDVHLYAWHKRGNKVLFKLWGCAPGSSVAVDIDGDPVSGSPFTVGSFGILIKIVPIPGTTSNELTAVCATPDVTTTVTIQ